MNVMIFAAGFGTRMRPLTDTTPKALIPVAGRALLDHALDQARAMGPRTLVVNCHHHADQMRAHL
jgi:MurNAc alpha-1-phosphate uridylyltransferase